MTEIERVNLSVYFVGIAKEDVNVIYSSLHKYLSEMTPKEQELKDDDYFGELEAELLKVVEEGFLNSKNSKVDFRDVLRVLKEFEIHSIMCSIEGKGTADYVINTLV